jgi:DNA-directed RNA polymerase subunit beta'
MPPEERQPLEAELYDGLKGLTLTGINSQGRHLRGIASTIASGRAGSPKEGFFQKKVIGRRQDLSMRSTIVPEPSLALDEVGIPRKAAAELYKPFLVANLVKRRGYPPLMAQERLKEDSPEAQSALEEVVAERPLLLKRDPVLHKYGVQAFKPKLIGGKAIKIHPLATSGYNADFDGDTMSAFVPVSQKAVKEAWKMLPSNNLFSPSTGFVMYKPTQESMQGLFKLTEMGKKTNKTFSTAADAARAVRDGVIGLDDVITVNDVGRGIAPGLEKLGAKARTTVGRMMLYNALPEKLRTDKVLADKEFVLNKDNLQEVLTGVAAVSPGDFGVVSDKLKDIGNARATGLSIGLADFVSDYEHRDKVLEDTRKKEVVIRANKSMSKAKRDAKIVELYTAAGANIEAKAKAKADAKPGRMYDWIRSGARGEWDNYKQMTVAPMLVADTWGRPIPVPINKSYSEGLDLSSYWASMYGARMGTISKAEGTWKPGLISKQMMRSTMDQMIVSEDCGTKKGIALPLSERDILGRFTAHDIKLKKGKSEEVIPAGTVIDPDVVNRLKNNKVTEVPVRTPLRCSHGKGLCARCYGLNEDAQLHQRGANVGVIAAQALGEPATQLSMNAFHTGGVVGAKGTTAQGTFDRVNQLLLVPNTLPGAAILSQADGKVEKVEKDAAGGWSVFVSKQRHYVPQTRELTVKKGHAVKKGDALSSGPKNPKEMLPLTGMAPVQRYLTDELHGIYRGVAPVKRRNTETFIRAMTNLSEVTDPGDHWSLLPGDMVPSSEVSRFNSQRAAGTKPVEADPVLHGVSVLPLEMQTDWLARMQGTNLRSTLTDAAAEGWRAALHGTHPIPGMAYGATFGQGTKEEPWLY